METRKDFMDRALLKMGESWKKALKWEFNEPYFKELRKFLEKEYRSHTIYPPPEHVFSWSHHCRIEDIKMVILGQDPYPGPGQANGLCFSVQKGIDQPQSLQNIFWAEQDVLLLNSVLTVRKGEAYSHEGKGWEIFTNAVISWISSNLNNVVFMLWGVDAQMKGSLIAKNGQNRHLILKAAHPSPQAVYQGFTDCGHFSKANQYLSCNGRTEIDWKLKQGLQTTKLDEAIDSMGKSWKEALNIYELKRDPDFIELIKFLEIERRLFTIYPPLDQVFSCTRHCRIHDVKVVILGQDPYHQPGQAHGLCFSVQERVDQPPSLQTIFEELESDIPGFKIPKHGDLTNWAKQGVLLLNCVLTVRVGKANSHKNQGWETFTDAVIKWISSKLNNVVFMLWGVDAQMKGSLIAKTNGHLILKATHPSPRARKGILKSVRQGAAINFVFPPGFFKMFADKHSVNQAAANINFVFPPGFFKMFADKHSVNQAAAIINFVLSPRFFEISAPRFFKIFADKHPVLPGAAFINFVLSPGFFEIWAAGQDLYPGAEILNFVFQPRFFELLEARQPVQQGAEIINFVLPPGFFEICPAGQSVQPGTAIKFVLSPGLFDIWADRQSVHSRAAINNLLVLSPGFCESSTQAHPNKKMFLRIPLLDFIRSKTVANFTSTKSQRNSLHMKPLRRNVTSYKHHSPS